MTHCSQGPDTTEMLLNPGKQAGLIPVLLFKQGLRLVWTDWKPALGPAQTCAHTPALDLRDQALNREKVGFNLG